MISNNILPCVRAFLSSQLVEDCYLDGVICGGGLCDPEADLLLQALGVHDQDLALRVAGEYIPPSSVLKSIIQHSMV